MNISRRNLFLGGLTTIGCGASDRIGSTRIRTKTEEEKENETVFKLYPVGIVERQGKSVKLRIDDRYCDALQGLEDFSHAIVLYWFDRNDTPEKRNILQVHPRGNNKNPLTGVFACRAPVRPNLIALSLCKILAIRGKVISTDKIDAFDGTPILDIKPYIPSTDCKIKGVRIPDWLKE